MHVVSVSTAAAASGATARSILQCVMELAVQREGGKMRIRDVLGLTLGKTMRLIQSE